MVAYQIETEADETQANGRVARQGKPGSIIKIIPRDELELLDIPIDEQNVQPLIPIKRKEKGEKLSAMITENLTKCEKKHNETMSIFTAK